MKNLMALVLALAIVAFAPGLGMAQDIGLQVTKIPVGLEIHTKSSSGERRVMTFLGKKRKFYEFSVAVSGRRGGNFTARQKFDAQGRYVQWIGGGDYKEKLRPYDCGYKLGDCRHRRLDQYGQGRAWIHRSTLKGNVVTAQRRLKFEPEFRVPRTITLGKYNIRMREEFTRTNGTKWWRAVTKIVEP